jgi:3-oxoacyl-[acyl-carrier protein] reductase
MKLKDQVAIITGGATGIGRAISLALAKEGASVIINYNKSKEKAETLVQEIELLGQKAVAIQADISNFQDAEKLIDETINHFGKLNILINNAGITDDALILRMSESQFDRVIETNLKGVFNTSKHAVRKMVKSDYGRIINITSVSGILGNAGQTNYSAAKAGIIGFTKALARELSGRNITVNAVAPGFIETEMTKNINEEAKSYWFQQIPLKRFGQVEDVANACLFLASKDASYITGHTLTVDGGLVMH